jgi:hypothetical protein
MKKAKSKPVPKKSPNDPHKQHARFVAAAKEAEADQRPNAMDEALKRLDLRKKQ